MTGIVSYGFYLPKYRIKTEEIAKNWGKEPRSISTSLDVSEKAVAGIDEDSLTMAYESAQMALAASSIATKDIGAVFVGSESHPYAVNPTATILAEYLGIRGNYLALDNEFACKAATSALISGLGLVKSGFADYCLITASDKAQANPHDALEYTAASASVTLIAGSQNVALEAVDYTSYATDTPDFWRREGMRYPSHGGRFTGKPSYFYHINHAAKNLLAKTKLAPSDFSHAVFHMPNGKFPRQAGLSLGFTGEQLVQSHVVSELGNSYTASALMGLIAVLEVTKPDDLIFFASFGSGAGSDAFVFRATKGINKIKNTFSARKKNKEYIDYATYLKFMEII